MVLNMMFGMVSFRLVVLFRMIVLLLLSFSR